MYFFFVLIRLAAISCPTVVDMTASVRAGCIDKLVLSTADGVSPSSYLEV